jgi:hypothetical protein
MTIFWAKAGEKQKSLLPGFSVWTEGMILAD